MVEIIRKEAKAFLLTFSFFSRLSIFKIDGFEQFPDSIKYIPVFSLISGAMLFGCFKIFSFVLPSPVPAILVFILQYVIFNYFHFDGFLDFIDGFLGGKSQKEILRIMDDTRVGTFAVLFGSVYISTKLFFYAQIFPRFPEVVIFVFLIGRLSFIFSALVMPYSAKSEGLGHTFVSVGRKRMILPLAFIILPLYFYPVETFFVLFCALLLSWHVKRKIGGFTGDVLGAICEVSELVWIIAHYSLHW